MFPVACTSSGTFIDCSEGSPFTGPDIKLTTEGIDGVAIGVKYREGPGDDEDE